MTNPDGTAGDEEAQEKQPGGDAGPSGSLDQATEPVNEVAARLWGGRTLSVGFAEFPVRMLIAIGIFVAVFMVVWMLLWAAAGGLGLALGWLLAAPAGALAVKRYADS